MLKHATKSKPKMPTLAQQLAQAEAQYRIWRDLEALPDIVYHSWCQASFTYVDSDQQATLRLVAWLHLHSRCGRNTCRVEQAKASAS